MTVFPKSRLFPQPAKQTLTVIVHREPGRSPSYWLGPDLAANENFNIHVAFPPLWGPAVFSIATTTIPSGHRLAPQLRPGWNGWTGRRAGASVMDKAV